MYTVTQPHGVSREELLCAAAWWMQEGLYDVNNHTFPMCLKLGDYTPLQIERLIFEVGCALRMLAAAPEVVASDVVV